MTRAVAIPGMLTDKCLVLSKPKHPRKSKYKDIKNLKQTIKIVSLMLKKCFATTYEIRSIHIHCGKERHSNYTAIQMLSE